MCLQRIDLLEKLASELIGDGKQPNVFFVTLRGNVTLITQSFALAYMTWRTYASGQTQECALEDRMTGTICSVEPLSDTCSKLCTINDAHQFGYL